MQQQHWKITTAANSMINFDLFAGSIKRLTSLHPFFWKRKSALILEKPMGRAGAFIGPIPTDYPIALNGPYQ
jgi:hypothetical protein